MSYFFDFLIYALATYVGAVAAEWTAIRWLQKHKPHLNKDNELEI